MAGSGSLNNPLSLQLKGPLRIPNLKGVVHPQAEQAIRLLYQSQNDLAGQLQSLQQGTASKVASPSGSSGSNTPNIASSGPGTPAGLNGSYSSPPTGLTEAITGGVLLQSPPTSLWTLTYYLYTITTVSAGTVTLTLDWQDEAAARSFSSAACSLTTLAMVPGITTLRTVGTAAPTPVTFSTSFSGLTGTPTYALFIRMEGLS